MLCSACEKARFSPVSSCITREASESVGTSGTATVSDSVATVATADRRPVDGFKTTASSTASKSDAVVKEKSSTIIVNEVLNFLKNSFKTSTCGQLKPVLLGFYNDDELTSAKSILHKALTDIEVCDLPRFIFRKGESKMRMTVDDLLDLFVIVDERKLICKLPRFVADDLSRIPTVCQDNINIAVLARKMEFIENRIAVLDSVEQRLNQVETTVARQQIVNCGDDNNVMLISKEHSACLTDSYCPLEDSVKRAVTDENAVPAADDSAKWNIVARKGRSKKQAEQPPVKARSNLAQGKRKILGEGVVSDLAGLQSVVPIRRKAVFHVDNLSPTSTESTIASHLEKRNIPVLTCHPAKSWLRDDEKDKVVAFRVCIPAESVPLFLDNKAWPQGVLVRAWKFKHKQQ